MKLSEFKSHLNNAKTLSFMLPEGLIIPEHFHITEAGLITKHFIDCGGVTRNEQTISFQIWVSTDTDHRLETTKLLGIISKYESAIDHQDLEIEFEYQADTINKYGLSFNNGYFVFTNKFTNCLSPDSCGLPSFQKPKIKLTDLSTSTQTSCCTPNSGCCN